MSIVAYRSETKEVFIKYGRVAAPREMIRGYAGEGEEKKAAKSNQRRLDERRLTLRRARREVSEWSEYSSPLRSSEDE
jgi:hypothetical protein